MTANPLLKTLGYAETDRLLIIHTDDVGMCRENPEIDMGVYATLNAEWEAIGGGQSRPVSQPKCKSQKSC